MKDKLKEWMLIFLVTLPVVFVVRAVTDMLGGYIDNEQCPRIIGWIVSFPVVMVICFNWDKIKAVIKRNK